MLSFDIETYPIAEGMLIPKPVCYSLADGNGTKAGPIGDFLLRKGQDYVGCNVAFDMAVLLQHTKALVWDYYDASLITDIAIREQLLDIARGLGTNRSYSLKSLAKRVLNSDLEKEDTPRLEYYKVDGLPVEQWPPGFKEYAENDARVTYDIWAAQEKDQYADHMHRWEYFETYSHFCLHLMEAWGVRADSEWWAKLKVDVDVKYKALQDKYRALGVLREDGSKDMTVMRGLVTAAYNGSPPLTDKGQVKTDRTTLNESEDPLLMELTGDGPVTKIVTTYGPVVEEACKRVYNPYYNVLVSTGRTSSNFQQWPRGGPNAPVEVSRLRGCFKPRPGYLYCSVDFTGAELVSLAQVCYSILGYSHLRDALNAGQNLHSRLGARFVGFDYDEFIKRLKSKDGVCINARQGAKPVNFGLPGLMGPDKLIIAAQKDYVFFCELAGKKPKCSGTKCEDCLELAQIYYKMYFEEWCEVKEYHDYVKANLQDPWSTPLTGFLRGGMWVTDACNMPFQHLSSRMAKSAIIAVQKACFTAQRGDKLHGVRSWYFAHDEIIAEIPIERAPEAADEMARTMVAAASKWTPDVLLTAEPALMDRWYKGADCVRDDKGVLQVWKPK